MWWGSRLLQKYCNLRYWIIQATGIWETAGKAGFSDFALKQVIKPSGERSLPIPGERSKLQKRQGEGSEFISHVVSPRLPHLVHTIRILFSFSLFFILLLLLLFFFFFCFFMTFHSSLNLEYKLFSSTASSGLISSWRLCVTKKVCNKFVCLSFLFWLLVQTPAKNYQKQLRHIFQLCVGIIQWFWKPSTVTVIFECAPTILLIG